MTKEKPVTAITNGANYTAPERLRKDITNRRERLTMNNEELKEALVSGRPVIFDMPSLGQLEYKCVSAIIYRHICGKLKITAELEDKCGHSVTIVDPKDIRFKEG